jgi:glycosyltransferase 2 family protein
MKKYGNLLLKILVSGVLFWFIFSKVDIGSVVENTKLLDFRFIPLIVFLLVSKYMVSSLRWKSLIAREKKEEVKVSYLTSLYFIGSFFNNFMPTSMGGDVFKVYALGKKIKDGALAFSSVFMERFTGMVVLVLVSYFGLVKNLDFWVDLLFGNIPDSAVWVLLSKILLFAGFWLVFIVGFLSLKLTARKISLADKIYRSLLYYKNEKGVLVWALLTSLVAQFLAISTQYFVFAAMGIDIPIIHALFIFPVITLAGFFIPSLNGLGVQDALYMQMFLVIGVPSEISLNASILYHLFRLSVSLIGGVLYALGKDK